LFSKWRSFCSAGSKGVALPLQRCVPKDLLVAQSTGATAIRKLVASGFGATVRQKSEVFAPTEIRLGIAERPPAGCPAALNQSVVQVTATSCRVLFRSSRLTTVMPVCATLMANGLATNTPAAGSTATRESCDSCFGAWHAAKIKAMQSAVTGGKGKSLTTETLESRDAHPCAVPSPRRCRAGRSAM